MTRTINYQSGCPTFTYFLFHPLKPGEFKQVSEDTFYAMVKPFLQRTPGSGLASVIIDWDKKDPNRQNYTYKGSLLGYRLR